MNGRIKELRKARGLTQQEFADKLGVKRGTVANYELDRNEPSNSVISLICREFNVNETWLRTGEGDMFSPMSRDEEFLQLITEIQVSDDEFILRLLRAYWNLNDEAKAVIQKLVNDIADK